MFKKESREARRRLREGQLERTRSLLHSVKMLEHESRARVEYSFNGMPGDSAKQRKHTAVCLAREKIFLEQLEALREIYETILKDEGATIRAAEAEARRFNPPAVNPLQHSLAFGEGAAA